MSDRKYYMRRYGSTGGMDTSTNPFSMSDSNYLYLKNVNHDENGSLSKDGGYSTFRNNVSGEGDDMVFNYINLMGQSLPIKLNEGNLFKAVSGDGNWEQVSAGVMAGGHRVSAVNFLDKVYLCDGETNLKHSDGSTVGETYADNGSSNVRGRYLEVLQNFLYIGHITTVHKRNEVLESIPGSHVFYNANLENHDTYATTDRKITVDGSVTGLKAYQGLLFIFTEDSIWYYNPDTREVKRLADTGCVSHETIKEIDGVLYWASKEGVYRFTGEGMPTIISMPITNWGINSLWKLIDGGNWRKLCAGVLDGRYHLWLGDLTGALPGDMLDVLSFNFLDIENSVVGGDALWYAGSSSVDSGGNTGWIFESPTGSSGEASTPMTDIVVVFDTYRNSWSFYDNHPVSMWATITDEYGHNKLIFGSHVSGQTFERDKSFTHNGAPIDSIIRTKYFDFDNPENEKVLGDLYVSYRPEEQTERYLEVGLSINGSNVYEKHLDSESSTKLPLTGSKLIEYQFERVSLGGVKARTASYEFRSSAAGVGFTLLGYSQEFTYQQPNLNYTVS